MLALGALFAVGEGVLFTGIELALVIDEGLDLPSALGLVFVGLAETDFESLGGEGDTFVALLGLIPE